MFCPNCGQQLTDGASFCMHCGTNIASLATPVQAAQPVIDFQAQKNSIRQSEITALAQTREYFSRKKNQFDEYDLVCDLVNYYSRGAKSSLLVWGCIILTFGLLGLLATLGGGGGTTGILIAAVIPGIVMMVGGILMKVNNRKKYAHFQSEYARLSQELYEYYMGYPNCPVGPEYANPDILDIIMGILQSGRADTIKESINLALSEADRAEVSAYLDMIEQNTAAINAQTRVAAVFAAANFFK